MSLRPSINHLNAPFWRAAEEGRLCLPHCIASRHAFWPPSPISPFEGGPVDWRDVVPVGLVESLVIYRRAFLTAFAATMPYGVAQVALDAGPRLQVHVAAPDAPDAPRAGDRVTIAFIRLFADAPPVPMARLSP